MTDHPDSEPGAGSSAEEPDAISVAAQSPSRIGFMSGQLDTYSDFDELRRGEIEDLFHTNSEPRERF